MNLTDTSRPARRPYAPLGRARWLVVAGAVQLGLAALSAVPGGAATVDTLGTASIARDDSASTWTLTAAGARLTLSLGRGVDYQVRDLESPTGRHWIVTPAADTTVVINGKVEALGRRAAGFELEDVRVINTGSTLRLDAVFRYRPANVRVTRHVAIADGAPAFEVWTSFEKLATDVPLEDLHAFELKVPDGVVRWVNGLRGETSDTHGEDPFVRQSRQLGAGEALAWGAGGRSSESTVPWIAIDGDGDEFFSALLWSGAWQADAWKSGSALSVSMGLAGMRTALTSKIEGPHAIFGVTGGGLAEVSVALQAYLVNGVRRGRGLSPLVTFNTWFADGTRIDAGRVRAAMARAAGLGVELFVLDAGWYVGAGAQGMFDFDSGLGSWAVDTQRFPGGLGPLKDYAHELGMRFGIWVEPERVDLDTLRGSGLDEAHLATSDGRHVTSRTGQVCLTGPGRQWVRDRLVALLEEVRPDYLKWDNNAWLNCDRDGHGHADTDGNFAHVSALYEILQSLRDDYPDLLIENVSGGGNRLDLGMVRYTDVGWMDDRSAPGSLVRRNAEGLSLMFPTAYLYSFVTQQDPTETLTPTADVALIFRSRMMGTLGLSFSVPGLAVEDAVVREIAAYKRLRPTLARAGGALLSEQAAPEGGPPWDVLQATTAGGAAAVLFVFQRESSSRELRVPMTALDPAASYTVESIDAGALGTASGADLMTDGVTIVASPFTAAHVLVLTRVESESPATNRTTRHRR